MEAKSSVMFSKLLLCIYLSSLRECHIWQIMTQYYLKLPISTYKFLFLLMCVNQGSSIKHSFFYVVSFSLESFINFFKMSNHMDKLLKNMQSKCFWFQHTGCSVGTNCEIGSWVYDCSMHLRMASPSREIFKGLKTRAGHDLVHEFKQKIVLGSEQRKTTSVLSYMNLNWIQARWQECSVSMEPGIWLRTLQSVCLLAGDHGVWTKMNHELLYMGKVTMQEQWLHCAWIRNSQKKPAFPVDMMGKGCHLL